MELPVYFVRVENCIDLLYYLFFAFNLNTHFIRYFSLAQGKARVNFIYYFLFVFQNKFALQSHYKLIKLVFFSNVFGEFPKLVDDYQYLLLLRFRDIFVRTIPNFLNIEISLPTEFFNNFLFKLSSTFSNGVTTIHYLL